MAPLPRDGMDHWPFLIDPKRRVVRPASKKPGAPMDADTFWRALRMVSEEGFALRFPPWFLPGSASLPSEQLRQALNGVLLGPHVDKAFEIMARFNLLACVIPEFSDCDVPQGSRHRYTVSVHSFKTAGAIKPELRLRMAALLHDLGKGRTYQPGPDRPRFPLHEVRGASIAGTRLAALGYETEFVSQVQHLIRWHMFNAGSVSTVESLERFVRRVGSDAVFDLLELRRADIVACGGPIGVETLTALQVLARRLEGILAGTPDSISD